MAKSLFPSYPPCCQKVLEELAREGRRGARNCANGHALNLERARIVEADAVRKAQEPAPPVAGEGPAT